jgi:hypothetical protein
MNASNHKLKINGIELSVLLAGLKEGLPVLLLHGCSADHSVWRYQIPGLVNALIEKQITMSKKLCPRGWRYECLEGVSQ